MRTVVLVPRREGKPDRDATWAWVRRWWQEQLGWSIFEGHHDIGPFNRSAAINRAAGMADWEQPEPWDVAVIIDADIIGDPDTIRRGVEEAVATGAMVLPFDVRRDLNHRGSQMVMSGFAGNWQRWVHRTYTEMVSSIVIVTRKLWDDIGGFDETFVGWGFEDNAFACSAETFGGPIRKLRGDVWHMFHETAREGKRGTPTHQRNKARADRYLAARGNPDAIRAVQRSTIASFEHHPVGIPRIIHRTVPEAVNEQAEAWWSRWHDLHPDWDLMTHRDPLDPAEWPETSPHWSKAANGAQLADLIRLEALLRWGGVYVDQDFQPFRSLEPLTPLSAFAAWEDARCVPNAVMGAVPAHPAIRECLDRMIAMLPCDTWDAGPGVTTSVFVGRDDVLLLPPEAFYPVHYRDPDRDALMRDFNPKAHPATFAMHHYWGSWLAQEAEVASAR